MGTTLFLSVRMAHVLLGAIWFGAIVLMVLYVAPAVQQSGPAGGQVMGNLVRRGLTTFMPSIAGLTIVTGILLYWRFTGGFSGAIIHSNAGLAFGIGGTAGLAALIIGGSMVSRGMKTIVGLAGQAAALPEGAERAAIMQRMNALRERTAKASKVVLALVTIAMVLMTLGHYV
jgi:hypothetical protein